MNRMIRSASKIAKREFVTRASSRAFLISNAIILLVIVGAIVAPVLIGGDDGPRRIGFTPGAAAVARQVEQLAPRFSLDVATVEVADANAARAAVGEPDGDVPDDPLDAALLGGDTVVVRESLPEDLEPLLNTATQAATVQRTLADTDLTAAQRESLLTPPEVTVEALDPPTEAEFGPALVVGGIAVFMLYGLLIFYGQFLALGVIEEKSSRVVEVLLSAVRPTALLYGKIIGMTALGVVQTIVITIVGVAAALTVLDIDIPSAAYGTLALAFAWFVLGFVLYAALFAVAASLVSSQEDLQATVFPVFIPLIGGFFAAQYSLQNPDSTVSLVTGLVPFTAPLVQPLRYGAQVAAPWEVPVALVLCVATIAVLVPLAARLYAGSVLRFGGRVKLGEAWRTSTS